LRAFPEQLIDLSWINGFARFNPLDELLHVAALQHDCLTTTAGGCLDVLFEPLISIL
jgi:hypothetical protein